MAGYWRCISVVDGHDALCTPVIQKVVSKIDKITHVFLVRL
jgi:hypothetical protein